ncbi:biotin transporter BioY [Treponema phagedenis]|uniref:Biotin transporter n=1 Tax=Treponema phagedenis TaxID=162 RepID=A0A7H8VS49_TREPH|nr:biotin transporter BioY [Treponema phagedenis]NVP24385.1 biotin transporter BioY [Treponema phagedenis]NVP25613.1 biotin transporter BioY [Treponema phagedenis]QEJ99018.1 biotin transporter BioY [Treponema phagedenis]QEK01846.1 biotin transporter BioY [Treponema phagedenis]QEK04528.1 biotin transporter BioY [Treponema phagedenis]
MNKTRNLIFSAIFAAVVCAGWVITIPVGPVPIVLQNALAILSGMLLGPVYGGLAVLLFLFAGALGLPVFAGGSGGIAVLAGPTGGFLIGYFLGAVVAGLISIIVMKKDCPILISLILLSLAAVCGFLTVYVPGVPWLKVALGLTWADAFLKGFVPFIIPGLIKAAIIVPISFALAPVVKRYLK